MQETEQASVKGRLMHSIATLFAGPDDKLRADVARTAVGLSEDACAGYLAMPDSLRREALLRQRQLSAGAATSTPAEAGAAAEAEDAAAAVTIQSRVPHTSRYASHISGSNGAKDAAVVVGPFHVATYHHQGHVHWSKGQEVQVCVHAGGSDTPCSIMGTVDYVDDRVDLVLIKVSEQLAAPVLDAQLSPGQRYFVLGQSAQAQGDASSVSHGIIAATQPDELSHVRGDIQVGRGDSGAGCFAVQTGRLIGMVVGVDAATHKSVLVPGAVLAYALSRVTAAA